MRKTTVIDRFFRYFAPKTALNREKSRMMLEILGERRFEAAAKSRRTANWNAPGSDANTAAHASLATLRNRSRDMVRNDGYAAKAVQVIVENTVGTGIVAKPTGRASGKVRLASEAWNLWADSVNADADGMHDFYGIQALALRTVVESGEVLIRRIRTTTGAIPFSLQVLEPDFLDTLRNETLENGNKVIQGVEFASGPVPRRVAYWLFDHHPGDMTGVPSVKFTSRRFPADDIIHLYRVERPGQVRGIPWGAPVMMTLKDFNEYEDAQLIRQKIAAAFCAFVYDSEMHLDPGGSTPPLVDKIEPGIIEYLAPGKDIKFATPPGVDGYSEYASQVLHKIAAGYGISHAALSGDLSSVNFSSGRMGWLEMQRNIESWRWRMLVPRLCNQVWEWFVEAAFLGGYPIQGVAPVWTPPRREMIDPNSELNAQVNAIRAGVTTLSEVIRQNGFDPVEVLNERAQDDALLDKLGITLDSDPRRIMKSGSIQQTVVAEAQAASANEGTE